MATDPLISDKALLQAAISHHFLQVSPSLLVQDVLILITNVLEKDVTPSLENQFDTIEPQRNIPGNEPLRCAWVVETHKLVGMITQGDILRLIAQGISLAQVSVGQVMSPPRVSLQKSELTHTNAVLHLFQQYQVLDIPIVNAADHLVGVMSQEKVLAQLNPTLLAELAQRQQLETTLSASERRYASLAETAPVGIFRTDPLGNCIYVNERWSQIAGINLEQAAGQGWLGAIHPLDRDRVLQHWQHAITESVAFQLEYRFQRPDGESSLVLGLAGTEVDAKGKVVGYVGIITDITERRQMEWAREKNEILLQRAEAIAHIGCWEADHQTQRFIYWSPEAYRIFERDPEKGVPSIEEYLEMVHPSDRPQILQRQRQRLEDRPEVFVHRLQLLDGRIKFVQIHSQSTHDPTGNPSRRLGTFQDITLQRQMELVQLQTAQKLEQLNASLTERVKQRTDEIQYQESRFQNFLDNANDLILSLNLITGKIEYVNRAWKTLFGYEDAEITQLTLFNLLHPEGQFKTEVHHQGFTGVDP